MTLKAYLKALTQAVARYGRTRLTIIEYPKELKTGFRTPDGEEVLVPLSAIKGHFVSDEWREDSRFGPKVVAYTRLPTKEAIVQGFSELVREAFARGEALHKKRAQLS